MHLVVLPLAFVSIGGGDHLSLAFDQIVLPLSDIVLGQVLAVNGHAVSNLVAVDKVADVIDLPVDKLTSVSVSKVVVELAIVHQRAVGRKLLAGPRKLAGRPVTSKLWNKN